MLPSWHTRTTHNWSLVLAKFSYPLTDVEKIYSHLETGISLHFRVVRYPCLTGWDRFHAQVIMTSLTLQKTLGKQRVFSTLKCVFRWEKVSIPSKNNVRWRISHPRVEISFVQSLGRASGWTRYLDPRVWDPRHLTLLPGKDTLCLSCRSGANDSTHNWESWN